MIETGSYVGIVFEWNLSQTSNNNPQFVLSFELKGRVNPEDPEGELLYCERETRRIYMVITGKTADFVIRDLKHLGYNRNTFAELDPDNPEGFDFGGIEVPVSCKHEVYRGEPKERWSLNYAPAVRKLEDKEVRRLDQLYGKIFEQSAPVEEHDPVLPDASEAPPDDEIPF